MLKYIHCVLKLHEIQLCWTFVKQANNSDVRLHLNCRTTAWKISHNSTEWDKYFKNCKLLLAYL